MKIDFTNPSHNFSYPIGKLVLPEKVSNEKIQSWIHDLEILPNNIEDLTSNLSADQLNWRYRKDGWMIKQVVHHLVDSHINSIVRFKLAVTEECPTIRPYLEHKWAELPDALETDLAASLSILKGLHHRLVSLIKSFTEEEFSRKFFHPEANKAFNLQQLLAQYSWHSRHHTAHIEQALFFKGKFN